jgi:predicted transglutaminase-like cysteine proteinase
MAQLRAVNDYLNRVPYVSDLANYGRSDRWATPAEFLLRGGDCEDYAIAKYVSLRRLGFADDSLRIVVVNDEARGIPHAVLSVRLDGASWILDNVTAAILADRDQPSYRPIYSLNMAGRWLHGRAGVEPAAAELR